MAKPTDGARLRKYAEQTLDRLIDLDQQTSAMYYEMGQLLHAIKEGKLHEPLGYTSFSHLCDEELSYSAATASKYANMYYTFKRLKYTKAEALNLLYEYGITNLDRVLPDTKTKLGIRAVHNRIVELDYHQLNFQVNSKQLQEVHEVLTAFGAVVTDNGRYMHSSDALLEIIRIVKDMNGARKKAA